MKLHELFGVVFGAVEKASAVILLSCLQFSYFYYVLALVLACERHPYSTGMQQWVASDMFSYGSSYVLTRTVCTVSFIMLFVNSCFCYFNFFKGVSYFVFSSFFPPLVLL